MSTETSIAHEVRALKMDNGLLKLANEQLANSYRQADQCATEREAQILSLMNQRDSLAFLLGAIIGDLPTNRDWLDPNIERSAIALLQQIREG